MSYHKADKHNNTANQNEDNMLAWAELEDNEVVIFTYIVSASTMTGAIAQAKQLDDTRKMEVAATWPSITQHMQDEHGEEITPRLLEDMNSYYMEFFRTGKFPEFKADGGRIGYRVGGGVIGGGEDMGANRVTETATTPEPQKIDFDTLRARLPKEIGDDIVRLIAASPEALEDFATIATQQDVDMFNQKYNVNLVLPQEA